MIRVQRFLLLTSFFLNSFAYSQTLDTLKHSIVFGGNIKGFWKNWKNADGTIGEWYQYNDRGRGDSTRSVYRVDEKGFPVSISVTGVDYMKNQVKEEFTYANGKASWKNNAEKDEKMINAPAFYLTLKGSAGYLYKALKASGNKITLLPYGEATLKTIQTHTIGKGKKTRKLSMVSLSGLGLTPYYTWIDDQNLEFASVSDWFSNIREGYESYIGELLAIQKKVEEDYFGELARQLIVKPGSILIKNVTLFDAVNALMLEDADVLVDNGIIKEITVGKRITATVARIIDGRNMTMLPGLWDMHVHLSTDLDGILHMASGITHVRDMGNDSSLLHRRQKFIRGELVGPDIDIMSGFIDGAGPLAAPTGALINNVDEGIEMIRSYSKKGYQQIKLYSSIKPEWVKPLAEEAHKNKMRVAGHIPAFMTAEQAIAAGYDEVTHLNMLALNFFGDTIDTRSPKRFHVPAQRTASLDLNGATMNKFIELLKTKNIAVDPTVGVFESLFTAREGKMEDRFQLIVDRLPTSYQRSIRAGGGGLPVPEGMNDTYLNSFDAFLKITKLLFDNGITIVAGTDGMAGFDLHHELELYVKAGIPPAKVLQLATFGTAVYIGKSGEFGSIATGRKADFILVEGNPVQNISTIRNTRWVVKNGILYDAAKLYQAVSIRAK